MDLGVHEVYVNKAKSVAEQVKEGRTDAQDAVLFKGMTLDKAKQEYDLAAGAREYAENMSYPKMYWPEDEYGLVKDYSSYPDGKIDLIMESDEYGTFSTRTIAYDSNWDKTPNSIKLEYWNPSTEYTYDKNGNCISIVESEHDKPVKYENYAYDINNQLTYREVDKNADGEIDEREYFTYCHCGQLESKTTIDSYGSRYEKFDITNGKLIETIDDYANDGENVTVGKYEYDDCTGLLTSFRQTTDYTDDLYKYNYNQYGQLSSVTYDNKYTDTLKGFLLGLFGDFAKDETFPVE